MIMIAYLTLSDYSLVGRWDSERQAWLFYIVEDKEIRSGACLSWNKLGVFSPILLNIDLLIFFFPNQRLSQHNILILLRRFPPVFAG